MLSSNVKNPAIVTLKTSEMNQSSSVALDIPAVAHREPDNGFFPFSETQSEWSRE